MAAGTFNYDGGNGNGSIGPVYLQVKGADLLAIFPLNYSYKNQCLLLGSPAETGMMQYDHKVTQPATILFTGVVKYTEWRVLDEIRGNLKSRKLENILCTFYHKSGRAERMIINYIEETGESARYDGVEVKVSLTEFLEHNVASN